MHATPNHMFSVLHVMISNSIDIVVTLARLMMFLLCIGHGCPFLLSLQSKEIRKGHQFK